MSVSQALNNAISGLTASSRMAEIVSSNLSNAQTPGYGRRELDLRPQALGGQGAGVKIEGVTRLVDKAILADRRLADAALAGEERRATGLAEVEKLISPPNDPFGLGGRLAAFEEALISAGADPASEQRLGLVLARLGDVTDGLKDSARRFQVMRQEADAEIASDVEELNRSLAQVEELNADITRARTQGVDPSPLVDNRQRVIDRIGSIVPIREVPRANDTIALWSTSGLVLIDGPAAEFSFSQSPTITGFMTLASGGLGGVERDGAPLDPANGYGKLEGGSLSASFAIRDSILVDAQIALDEIAADLITRFADPVTDPTLVAGDPGLLTDGGVAHNPADIVELSRRISISAAIDPAQGGLLSRLRDGVNATVPGPVGNADQMNRWTAALSESRSIGGGIPDLSASGQIGRVAAGIGIDRVRADETLSFALSRRNTIHEAELAGGVDSDAELQKLLRIEQSYAANARLIQTVQAMIQILMEI